MERHFVLEASCRRLSQKTLLTVGSTKSQTLAAALSIGVAKSLALKKKHLQCTYVLRSQQNSLRQFVLRICWIMTTQSEEFMLLLLSPSWNVNAWPFFYVSHILYLLLLVLLIM